MFLRHCSAETQDGLDRLRIWLLNYVWHVS